MKNKQTFKRFKRKDRLIRINSHSTCHIVLSARSLQFVLFLSIRGFCLSSLLYAHRKYIHFVSGAKGPSHFQKKKTKTETHTTKLSSLFHPKINTDRVVNVLVLPKNARAHIKRLNIALIFTILLLNT